MAAASCQRHNGAMTSEHPPERPPPAARARDAAYFDQWYADMAASSARDAMIARAFGRPAEEGSASLLTAQGSADLADALRLSPEGLVVDVACGRGGHGIEVARRSGVRLVGIDFSAVALEQARTNGARLLAAGQAEFRMGTLVATGLPAHTADAVLCVDSVQFAEPPLAALTEFRRLLTPGGRLAVTCWEAVDPHDDRVPPRIRAVDLARDLPAAGFIDVRVQNKADWRQAERVMWEHVVAADGSDAAVRSLQDEGRSSLAAFDSLRRVLATATAP